MILIILNYKDMVCANGHLNILEKIFEYIEINKQFNLEAILN
jgi:hypothetical protein